MTRPFDYPFQPRSSAQEAEGKPITVRQVEKPAVPLIEHEPNKYIALALVHLRNAVARLPVMLEDNSRPVDSYRPQTIQGESFATGISVPAQWETNEVIRAILVTGPASTAFTLQLGDRVWTLQTNAQNFMLMSPMWLILDRSDPRNLIPSAAGDWALELMGHADARGQLV